MSLRTRFWWLAALRWLPTGMIIPVVALLPVERGLTIAELGVVWATQGVVVLLLELPTGGLADAVGRKPVLVVSVVFAIASYVTAALAHDLAAFVGASALAGVFRALDSGPLNAWFVDAVHDDPETEDRPRTVARGLSGYASIAGVSIATGAVTAGGLVAWAPLGRSDALAVPYWIAAALAAVQLVAVVVLMDESRPADAPRVGAAVRGTPRTVAEGARLLVGSRVLAALVAVELFWGFGMIAFESLMPLRLSEMLADSDEAATLMGPVTAAAWAVSALGAAMVPWVVRRWSLVAVSVALRLLQGATVVGMGLALGPVGLVAGLLATYALHSASGAIYETLLHEQVDNQHRATVLSLASMVMHPGAAIGGVVLGATATAYSTGSAIVVGGIVLALAAPLFLVRDGVASADVHPSR